MTKQLKTFYSLEPMLFTDKLTKIVHLKSLLQLLQLKKMVFMSGQFLDTICCTNCGSFGQQRSLHMRINQKNIEINWVYLMGIDKA